MKRSNFRWLLPNEPDYMSLCKGSQKLKARVKTSSPLESESWDIFPSGRTVLKVKSEKWKLRIFPKSLQVKFHNHYFFRFSFCGGRGLRIMGIWKYEGPFSHLSFLLSAWLETCTALPTTTLLPPTRSKLKKRTNWPWKVRELILDSYSRSQGVKG